MPHGVKSTNEVSAKQVVRFSWSEKKWCNTFTRAVMSSCVRQKSDERVLHACTIDVTIRNWRCLPQFLRLRRKGGFNSHAKYCTDAIFAWREKASPRLNFISVFPCVSEWLEGSVSEHATRVSISPRLIFQGGDFLVLSAWRGQSRRVAPLKSPGKQYHFLTQVLCVKLGRQTEEFPRCGRR